MTDDPKHPEIFADEIAWLRTVAEDVADLTAELHTLDEGQLTQLCIETTKVEARVALLSERIKTHRALRRRQEVAGYV